MRLRFILPPSLLLASFSLFANVAARAQAAPASTTPAAATTPAGGGGSPAAAPAATPPASGAPATVPPPTACAAAFGIFGPINASGAGGNGAGGSSTPAQPPITINNNAASPASSPSAGGAPAKPPAAPGAPATPQPAGAATTAAGAPHSQPAGTPPGNPSTKPIPLGLTNIFDLNNPTLTARETRDNSAMKAANARIVAENVRLAARGAPLLPVPPLTLIKEPPIPLNAADVAAALQGKIPGVVNLVAIGPTSILYVIDPSKAASAPPIASTQGLNQAHQIEDQLVTVLDALPRPLPKTDVIDLPDGFQGACAIIGMVGHQVPGIVSLAALTDNRILAGYKDSEHDKPLKDLKTLIGKLAVSSIPPAPKVRSDTMRLYYDRDAVSVATAVQSAFSQLKVQSVSMNPTFPYRDVIVIADPTGTATTNALDQARRMVAQLDEPRAQVAVNAWSLQISRDQPAKGDELVPEARRLANGYNDALEDAVSRGWLFVNKLAASTPTNFSLGLDAVFSSYLCRSYTYNGIDSAPTFTSTSRGLCPNPTDDSLPQFTQPVKPGERTPAKPHPYALGYSSLFGQEDPDLVQMMILVMAATKPCDAINDTIDAMEGHAGDSAKTDDHGNRSPCPNALHWEKCCSCQEADTAFYYDQNKECDGICKIAQYAGAPHKEQDSFYKYVSQQVAPRRVAFNCTRAKLIALTASDGSHHSSSFVGQFRAAVADYLFQNKMKTEYPNDFDPFLFPASAATLDAALTPIVEAFNQDLEALQQNLQHQLTADAPKDKHLNYTSNGLISVKVISGNQALAQTQSLNYFPQNPTVTLESIASKLAAAQSSGPPLLAGSLSSVLASTAAYAAALPQQITAKVGSGLSLTVTPFTLSSAKGAELQVNVTYNENGAATISSDTTQANGTDDLNSRVAEHEVNTLVRMDSLKFFEISTMQSVIARQRRPWKPFDPFFELPLLDNPGSFGIRRKPDVIYNQSIIFLEASIMPTAADLGQGLIYKTDQIAAGACANQTSPAVRTPAVSKPAHSAQDFCFDEETQQSPLDAIKDYHKQMIAYFGGQYIDGNGTVTPPTYLTNGTTAQ